MYGNTYVGADKTGWETVVSCFGVMPGTFEVIEAAIECRKAGSRRRKLLTPVDSLGCLGEYA